MITLEQIILIIIEVLISFFLGTILEHKLGIISKLKKFWYLIINTNSSVKLYTHFNSKEDFEETKNILKNIMRNIKINNKIEFKIKEDSKNTLEIIFNNYLIKLNRSQKNEKFIETQRIECGIRNIKNKLLSYFSILDELNKKIKIKNDDTTIKLFLPFKWTHSQLNTPKNLEINSYNVKFKHNKYESEIIVKMNNSNNKLKSSLTINGKNKQELTKIVEEILSLI